MRHFIVLMFSLSFYSCCCFVNYELSTPHPLESAAFKKMKEKKKNRDFLESPVVKTLLSNAGGASSIPGQGTSLHASRSKNQNIKQNQYCNKFNKNFKNMFNHVKEKLLFLKQGISSV